MFRYNELSITSGPGTPRLPNRDAKGVRGGTASSRLDAATMVAKGNPMSDQRELRPVQPCILPVNDPSLAPEYFNGRGGYSRVPCHACGVQHDRREIEQYPHPHAIHVSRFMCPKGHLGEARRLWEPAPADTVVPLCSNNDLSTFLRHIGAIL